MVEMNPGMRATEFVRIESRYIILPPEDVNMSADLQRQRSNRIISGNIRGNEFLDQLETLLKDAPISDYFKYQLVFESALDQIRGLASDELQRKLADDLGISLEDGKYGIFDSKSALLIEAKYYAKIVPIILRRESEGIVNNPVSVQEWGQEILKRKDQLLESDG